MEEESSPVPRRDVNSSRRATWRVQLYDRLAQRKGLRSQGGARHPTSMGHGLDHRSTVRFRSLHGILRARKISGQGMGHLQEIRERPQKLPDSFFDYLFLGQGPT